MHRFKTKTVATEFKIFGSIEQRGGWGRHVKLNHSNGQSAIYSTDQGQGSLAPHGTHCKK